MNHTATYSPDDDKIRITPAYRLDKEDYDRVKAAGYRWAPMQKVFFCVWNPAAEDIAIEMCGEIDDEDTTLMDRAEVRADRFDDYSDNRKADAERARQAVSAIADNIPLGQPILVGHHSERHARRDAEKIENGMRKAVSMWKTSEYWKGRAASALQHAKYLERPDVRARRIKGLESDIRVWRSKFTPATHETPDHKARYTSVAFQQRWNAERDAPAILHVFCAPRGGKGGMWTPVEDLPGIEKHYTRWIEHAEHRLEYERGMLEEQGATALLDKKPKSWAATLPLCNYRAPEGIQVENPYQGTTELRAQVEMTQAEYSKIYADYKGTRVVENSHRVRTAVIRHAHVCVFLTDSKVHAKPAPGTKPERKPRAIAVPSPESRSAAQPEPESEALKAMEASLKAGVQVVSANQLFPTPLSVCRAMVDAAELELGMHILEPSAGTGNICDAINESVGVDVLLVAIEINAQLAQSLRGKATRVVCMDFLSEIDETCEWPKLGDYDRILMNPPFENGADIKHIQHALSFLKPGGRLVAICANGPRQNEKLKPLADSWEELPEGTFAGTGVRTVMLVINKREIIPPGPVDKGGLEELLNDWADDCIGIDVASGPDRCVEVTIEDGKVIAGKEVTRQTQGPALAENEAERQRMTYAGRSLVSLRESKRFDSERLASSPLFDRRLF